MRISDWSSDVCSSDLKLVNSEAEKRGYTYAIWYVKSLFETCNRLVDYSQFESFYKTSFEREDVQNFVRFSPRNRLYPKYDIGRASCRERVCHAVYISVVAVTLKKNQKKQKNNT